MPFYFGEDPQVSYVSKKDEREEEIEKKLPNEYKIIFIPKRSWVYDPSIGTFSFNMHIFGQ